jgi:hypothetical protein
MRRGFFSAAAAAGMIVLLASCQSFQGGGTPDERAIAKGTTAWNEKEPSAARPFWASIKDKNAREMYTSYVDGFESGSKALADAQAAKPAEESKIQASYEKARKSFASRRNPRGRRGHCGGPDAFPDQRGQALRGQGDGQRGEGDLRRL